MQAAAARCAGPQGQKLHARGWAALGPSRGMEVSIGPLGACWGVQMVFHAEGPQSPGVFAVGFPGAFVDGLNGVRVGNPESSWGIMRKAS